MGDKFVISEFKQRHFLSDARQQEADFLQSLSMILTTFLGKSKKEKKNKTKKQKKTKTPENTKLAASGLIARENYSLHSRVSFKMSLLIKLRIGYLINKERVEACIRIAMLITSSEKKKKCFFT